VLEAVSAEGRTVIEDVYPVRVTGQSTATTGPAVLAPLRRTVDWSGPSGVVEQFDLLPLIDAAAQVDTVVRFHVGVGDVVHAGTPLADLHGGDLADDVVERTVVRGSERSFDQDPMLAIRLLADIALRALSPAVNDPASAVDALDATEGLLRALTGRDIDVRDITDPTGQLRIRLQLPTWDEYTGTAIADLIALAGPFVMVLARLRQLLENLIELAPPAAQPGLVRLHARVSGMLALQA
jgi:uncharacterized membrane protein